MVNANIIKRNYRSAELEPLSESERSELANAVIGHGNMVKAVVNTSISDVTIRRAIGGFKLTPPTRETLRNFIAQNKQA